MTLAVIRGTFGEMLPRTVQVFNTQESQYKVRNQAFLQKQIEALKTLEILSYD